MISVTEAYAAILNARPSLMAVNVPIRDAYGAVCASDVTAKVTLPPHDASAMDGYAARFEDARHQGVVLSVIGESPAGTPFDGTVGAGQAVRIFTGSVIPKGADTIVIQENVTRNHDVITTTQPAQTARHIRKAGIDFRFGDVLVAKGDRITAAHIALLAAGNHAHVHIVKRPIVALIANGDELRVPGSELLAGQIINSNPPYLSALLRAWGAKPVEVGIASDSRSAIIEKLKLAKHADIIVPIGGASVGDHDHMRAAFTECGLEMIFEKIAVKPGKPTWFGKLGQQLVLGLPGNPASAAVCAHLFLKPLISGQIASTLNAKLDAPISANGPRESYFRAKLSAHETGLTVTPFPKQDSSLITPLSQSNALIKLLPNTGPWDAGERIDVIALGVGPDIMGVGPNIV